MKVGVHVRLAAGMADIRDVAGEVERLGFESLFVPEHTHLPLVGLADGEVSEQLTLQAGLLDPFVLLAAAAAVTERIRLGTGVCLLPVRDPILLAKEVASLDVLSNGRVLFGVGTGSHPGEARNHGVRPMERAAIGFEHLAVVKQIWQSCTPSFDGSWIRFGPIRQEPKPLQRPHPPVLIAGDGNAARQQLAKGQDHWFPHHSAALIDQIAVFKGDARHTSIPITVFAPPANNGALERYRELGVERVVLRLPDQPGGDWRRGLNSLVRFL